MQRILQLTFVVSLHGLIMASDTWNFYQATWSRPILMYECYRTGVTVEPENTVNFTILWDCTGSLGNWSPLRTWTAQIGQPNSYQQNSDLQFRYDEASDSVVVASNDYSESIEFAASVINEMAYYMAITVTSEQDRKVAKLYDEESGCGNAAELLHLLDIEGKSNFVFSRAVVEPTRTCQRSMMCA